MERKKNASKGAKVFHPDRGRWLSKKANHHVGEKSAKRRRKRGKPWNATRWKAKGRGGLPSAPGGLDQWLKGKLEMGGEGASLGNFYQRGKKKSPGSCKGEGHREKTGERDEVKIGHRQTTGMAIHLHGQGKRGGGYNRRGGSLLEVRVPCK